MKSFLEYVAEDLIAKYGTDLSRVAVVFPNKRAALFLNEALVRIVGKPMWSPAYLTISELFRKHSQLKVADPIKLICDLHKSFCLMTGKEETIDAFYGWGQLLLADFDDIDKNMADADKVFSHVRDIHELDDLSYLSQEQKEIIGRFFGNFSGDSDSELKQRFLALWSRLADIYQDFNQRLLAQGLAYEGALYRRVITDETVDFGYEHYVFVGFNMIQKVEQQLFSRLKQEKDARFYWDYDAYYMPHAGKATNEAGYYISQYMKYFPNELDGTSDEIYDNFSKPKQVTFISAPTENVQARFVNNWLSSRQQLSKEDKTAIVLCDENLLLNVIHALPDEVENVNVTTGLPLSQTPSSSLVEHLFELQTAGYASQTRRYRLYAINRVLHHPYAVGISSQSFELAETLKKNHVYYADRQQLCLDEGLSLLFEPLDDREKGAPAAQLCDWLVRMIRYIARHLQNSSEADTTQILQRESLFQTYIQLNRLHELIQSGDLEIEVQTLQRLISQMMQSTTIPFHGEPAVNLQLMGVLETRNLDFDHVLMLSCNEGNMPKGVSDTSFIPYSIRKAYDLTTIDHKVAIYSYYFHRLLQRASDVTLLYNNATENGKTGEMSRFMLQLLVESGHPILQQRLLTGQTPHVGTCEEVIKTSDVMERLLDRFDGGRQSSAEKRPLLSPTSVSTYLRCPKRFYYHYVCGLKELDDVDEDALDNRVFGLIFHDAARQLHLQLGSRISREAIKSLLQAKIPIEVAVDHAIRTQLFCLDEHAPMPQLNGLQIIQREVIIEYLRSLLKADLQLAPFQILGLEIPVVHSIRIDNGSVAFDTTIGGTIDRLDCVNTDGTGEKIRVVDYKTGGKAPKAPEDIADVFNPENVKNHSDYYLQTFLYGTIVRTKEAYNPRQLPVSPALFFVQHAASEDYDPTLRMGKEPIDDVEAYRKDFVAQLHELLNEMFHPEIPFRPTADVARCTYCPYAKMCNRG